MSLNINATLLFLLIPFLFYSCKNKVDNHAEIQVQRAIEIGDKEPKEALLILDSIHDPKGLGERYFMLYQIADVRAKRNLDEPIALNQIDLLVEGVTFFTKEKDFKNAALANYYAARAYHRQCDVKQELTHYLNAYSCAEKLDDSLMMGKSLYNIGLMYADQQVFDSTIVYFRKAIPLFDKLPEIQIQAYRLLALTYYQKDDLNSALDYLDKGTFLLEVGDNNKFSYLYNMLYGAIYKREKEYEKSIDYLQKNMMDAKTPEDEKVRTALNLIDVYIQIHKMDSATYYTELVEPQLQYVKDDELLAFAYDVLHNYYLEEGDNLKAKDYYALFKQRQDIIKEQNEAETLFTVTKEAQIEQLKASQKEYERILCLIIIFIVLFIVILVFLSVKIKVKGERIIKQQKEEIEQLRENAKKVISDKE